jgi:hypothetical protein
MPRLPQDDADVYLVFLERAITHLRMRIRYGEQIAIDEVHDYLDALHNVPALIRGDGEWFTEANIARALAHFDNRWLQEPGSDLRRSLVTMLDDARSGPARS